MKSSSEWRKVIYHLVILYLIRNLSVWCFNNQHWQTFPVIQSRYLLRLALNGYTQIQIEKILFPIMNFRFSPSARLAEESLSNPNCHSEPLGEESRTLPINRHLEPLKNLMQGLLEIFRYRSIWRWKTFSFSKSYYKSFA